MGRRKKLKPGQGQAPKGFYWSGKDWRPYTKEELEMMEKLDNESKTKETK